MCGWLSLSLEICFACSSSPPKITTKNASIQYKVSRMFPLILIRSTTVLIYTKELLRLDIIKNNDIRFKDFYDECSGPIPFIEVVSDLYRLGVIDFDIDETHFEASRRFLKYFLNILFQHV